MGNALRREELSLEEDLLKNSRSYSFEMAAKILSNDSNDDYGKEISIKKTPFRTVSINTFYLRGTEIEKIIEKDDTKFIFIERLSLAGLNAPLPTPYAEIIYNRNLAHDYSFGQFLNTFNSRILGISYQISKRRYVCLQADEKDNYLLQKTIANFFGEEKIDRKLSRLAYIFWTKEKSAVGLESGIKSIFDCEVKIDQLTRTRLKNNEKNRLGYINLGKNSDLGSHFTIINLGVSIYLDVSYSQFMFFISESQKIAELKFVIKKYLGDFFKFSVFITPKVAPKSILGKTCLGKTSWFNGTKFDYAKV